jgi:hypothetical protein
MLSPTALKDRACDQTSLRDGAHETVNEWQTSQCVIPKSGHRFSDKITHKRKVRDPEKWTPVFGQDHAQTKSA